MSRRTLAVPEIPMPRSVLARLRRAWLQLHLWVGVGLAVGLIPLSLSGAALVWRAPLERALHAERYAISGPRAELPLSAYVAAARGALGVEARLSQVRLPQRPGDPVVAVGRMPSPDTGTRPRSLTVWIDPPTGKVLARGETARDPTLLLHRFHENLLAGRSGRQAVGWLGWAMLANAVTGLWLWWPRGGPAWRGLRWRRGAAQLFNLHHAVGVWICVPLAVLSLTGVYLAFPQTARALAGAPAVVRPAGPAGGGAPLADPALSPDEAAAGALALAPGARLASVDLPRTGTAPAWRVGLASAAGPVGVSVDDGSGRAGRQRAGAVPRGGDPVSAWMRRLHDGVGMGPVWRTVITLAGLAPTLLAASGTVMWLRRRARRRALARG
jgi:uncharacterized iron-regulated membrane protein